MSGNNADPAPIWDDESHVILAEAVNRLETAWEAGTYTRLADFLPVKQDDPRYQWMLIRLIDTYFQCRARSGPFRDFEEHLKEWPQLADKQSTPDILTRGASEDGPEEKA